MVSDTSSAILRAAACAQSVKWGIVDCPELTIAIRRTSLQSARRSF